MATSQGTVTLDFGAYPGSNEASVAVIGQSNIVGTANAEAYVMASDSTGDHTENDHRYFPLFAALTCGNISVGVGFTIYATSAEKLQGQFIVHWVWAD